MNTTVKQYVGSLKQDLCDLDILMDKELTNTICRFIIADNIEVLEDLKENNLQYNYFVNEKIDFLKECLQHINKT